MWVSALIQLPVVNCDCAKLPEYAVGTECFKWAGIGIGLHELCTF